MQFILSLNNKLQAAETVVLGMMLMRDPFFIVKCGKIVGTICPSPIAPLPPRLHPYTLSVHGLQKKFKIKRVVP